MTNNNQFSMRFADEFENNLYKLSKKYRNIKADIKPIIEQLLKGDVLGDRISGFCSDIYVYKIRVKNSNIQKGKSVVKFYSNNNSGSRSNPSIINTVGWVNEM